MSYEPQQPGRPRGPARPSDPAAEMPDAEPGDSPRPPRRLAFILKLSLALALSGTILAAVGAALLFWHFSRGLPDIITVADYHPLGVTRVLSAVSRASSPAPSATPAPAASGKAAAATPPPVSPVTDEPVIAEFFKERRYLIPYEKIPVILVRAFISAEDDKFFDHPGINLTSIVRASIANFRAGHVVQGGSTITQQVAKSLLLDSSGRAEKTIVRKIREAILSTRIERNLTKQQILYLYLNQIYLGHGAYGVQSAARTYFRKDVSQLTVAESAILAGMPQAPGKYSPLLNPKKAKERQLYVLRRLLENGYINQAQHNEATALPLKVFHDEDLNAQYSAYYVEFIRKHLVEKYGEKAVYEDGLTVTIPTTREMMLAGRRSLRDGLGQVDKRTGYRGPLRRLDSPAEMEKFLKAQRQKLVERKTGFIVLLPDGRLDSTEAMYQSGVRSEAGLLEADQIYEAVVTSLDDARKSAGVMIGGARAELPIRNMSWARTPRVSQPSTPSKVLAKGDVILVKLAQAPEKDAKDGLLVSLEQTPGVQGALFSMETLTGNVLAMEGGYDFEASEFNRATQAQRQPGSAFKPIIFAAAVERGFTPASIIVDSPITYSNGDDGKWKPKNFEEKFYGDTTLRQALIHSRNIPTIKLVQAIQVGNLIEYAKRLGIATQFPSDLSIALGSATSSLLDLTRVYALFPRFGRLITPIFITRVTDRDGKVLEENKAKPMPSLEQMVPPMQPPSLAGNSTGDPSDAASPAPVAVPVTGGGELAKLNLPKYPPDDDPDQVMDPRVAYVMTNLMKEVVNYGTGHEAKSLNRPAAGKTGTTSESIDAWFMGFTPYVVTGSWVGYDSSKPIGPGETGARAALPIWLSFMHEAVKPYPETDFATPSGVVFASIDQTTGKLAASNSSHAIREAFIEGTQPTEFGASTKKATPDIQGEFFKEDID